MPRRYQDYNPDAGLARMAGGLGFGIAAAGEGMTKHFNTQNDQNYRDNQSNIQQNQFGQNMTLNRDKMAQQNKQFAANQGLGWANHNQRNEQFDYQKNNPAYQNVNTGDGVYAVNPRDPNVRVRLGDGVTPAASYPSLSTYKTDEGVYMYDKKNPAQQPTRLGGTPAKQMTPYDAARLAELERKRNMEVIANYGDSWSDYTPDQQRWVLQEAKRGVLPDNVDEWGWSNHYPKGYQAPAAQDGNGTAELDQLKAILQNQNAQMKKLGI